MASESVKDLAAALEQALWDSPSGEFQLTELDFGHRVTAAGVKPAAVMAELLDETLAVLVREKVFRNEAFQEWAIKRYEAPLLGYFHNRSRSRDRAHDLLQGFYLKLLDDKTLRQYNAEDSFHGWFWRVVHNYWVSEARRTRRTVHSLPEVEIADPGPCPVDESIARELADQVKAAMTQLPADQRHVLECAVRGVKAKQIAIDLGMELSRVYRMLFQGRRQVERSLRFDSGVAVTHSPLAVGAPSEKAVT